MAQKTIPELNPISALEDNYAFPLDSGIQTYKVFWSTIKAFLWNHVIGTFTALTTPAASDLIPVELGSGGSAGEIRKVTLSDLKKYVTEEALIPIGGVLGFFDFNGLLSYNPDVFTLVRGQTISDVASPLHGIVLPNATGRALIGYGAEGGSNQASAGWTINPVGNPSHSVNLSHSHRYSASLREIAPGSGLDERLRFQATQYSDLTGTQIGTGVQINTEFSVASLVTFEASRNFRAFYNYTSTALNSVVDIRMRSIQVRWLLRYK